MPTIDRDGTAVYYEEAGSGPAVLLTHGYAADLTMWDSQVAALADRYRVVRWDMRGHGRSDSPADASAYSHEATVADMAAVLDACGVERAVVGGLSLGGFMSMAFHLAHPDRVRALMLFDTGPGYRNDAARDEWNRYAEEFASTFERDGLAALAQAHSVEMRQAGHRDARGLVLSGRGMLTQKDARVIESLSGITVPTLVVAGGEDTLYVKAGAYIASKVPGASNVVIDGAGHAPNIEKPEAFNACVLSFLGTLR